MVWFQRLAARGPPRNVTEWLALARACAGGHAGDASHRKHGGRGGYTGTVIGALILLTTLLTILQMSEGARRIPFGLIVLFATAAHLRIVDERQKRTAAFDPMLPCSNNSNNEAHLFLQYVSNYLFKLLQTERLRKETKTPVLWKSESVLGIT